MAWVYEAARVHKSVCRTRRGSGVASRCACAEFSRPPVKAVVAYPAGGPTDTIARVVTRGLSAGLGQSVVVENQAGAGGRIGTRAVARAAPDGYTLLLCGSNNNAITPALYKGLDLDPMKETRADRRAGDRVALFW